jgi:DNA-binding CsgD family transcriptional regulator
MREIAELLAYTDKSTKEIAFGLGIAEGTVRVHLQRIKKSLNVESRAQLVRLFLESRDHYGSPSIARRADRNASDATGTPA